MSTAQAGVLVALVLALADLAFPIGSHTRPWRRVLRAGPALALAVTVRLCDGPALLAVGLAALAFADALAADKAPELGAAELAVTTVAGLLAAAFLFEMADLARLSRAPWRGLGAVAVIAAAGMALARRRPAGPLRHLAGLPFVALAAAALFASVAPPSLALTGAAVAALAVGWGLNAWTRGVPGGLSRLERALRSGGALLLAWPVLLPV